MYSIPASTSTIQSINPASKNAFVIMGTVLFGTGSVYGINQAEAWREHVQPRVSFILDAQNTPNESIQRPDIRAATEHLENIRSVLNLSVADLASFFDVSRQAIYKWLSGDSTPEQDKLAKIVELSRIADIFHAEKISRAESLVKMKTFAGKSLIELIKSGSNRVEHVDALIEEAKLMQASHKQSGLATSKSKPTNDWQSSISIPGSIEQD